MTIRTTAEITSDIQRAEAEEAAFFVARTDGGINWLQPPTDDDWRDMLRIGSSLKALREELLVAERIELDAATDERTRTQATRLREAYITNASLWLPIHGNHWDELPLYEARAWAAVAHEAARHRNEPS